MSEKITCVRLKELDTVRITHQCGGSLEVKMSQLRSHLMQPIGWSLICPGCGNELRRPSIDRIEPDAFDRLEAAIREIKDRPGVEIAFIIRTEEEGAD